MRISNSRPCRALIVAFAAVGTALAVESSSLSLQAMKKLSLEELMNVEVTSVSRRPEKLGVTASAIQVVTGDDIRRFGASNLPEALRLAGNLDVAQKSSHEWGITARGFNTDLANKLLVMIDGRTVYTPLFSGVIWEMQDYLLEDIDRIEVISGPGGTLWGANAVNGVINIITRSAKDSQGIYVEAGAGSSLARFASARYGLQVAPSIYLRVYGKAFERNAGVLANGSSAADASTNEQAGFRLDSEALEQNTVTFSGDYYRGEQMSLSGTGHTSGGNLLGRWTHLSPNGSDFRLQLYYDRAQLNRPQPPLVIGPTTLAPAGVFQDTLDTYDLDLQHHFTVGSDHQVIWGLGYRFTHDVTVSAPSLAFLPLTLDQELVSGFLQDAIALGHAYTLTIGSKLEHNDYTGLEIEPSVRLQWNVAPDQSLWAAVSRAVRRPSRIDRDLAEAAPPNFLLLSGGRDFRSEDVIAYEVGHRAQFGPKLSTSLSLFFNDYDHIRSTTTTPAIFPLIFQNNLEGHTQGFEFTADYQVMAGWRLHGAYTLLRDHLRVKPGAVDINRALNEISDPGQQATLRSSVDLPHAVELDAALRWVDSRGTHSGATPGTVPSYAEMDLHIGWHPVANLELSIVGKNLLHDRHGEYGFPSPTNVEIERSVTGKASWRF